MDSIKVLMVDDESRMRKLVKDFLTREGYMVLEAGDGEQALDIFMNDKNISLVILDVMMPKMDGWETLKEIRKFSQVPVIMLTAKADERDELQGFDLGVDLVVNGKTAFVVDQYGHFGTSLLLQLYMCSIHRYNRFVKYLGKKTSCISIAP